MRGMGIESDQEVVSMIGEEAQFAALLAPSLEQARSLSVFTQQQALAYLGGACIAQSVYRSAFLGIGVKL